MRSEEKVILVDASSVFFRAYYAIPYMTAKKNSKKTPSYERGLRLFNDFIKNFI